MIFKRIYSFYLANFSENEVSILYSKLPMTSFTSNKSDFEKIVAKEAEKIRGEQEKYKLHQLWEKQTSSKTPSEWSTKNRTPILSLVPPALHADARRAFNALNSNNAENAEIKFALEFLQNKATFFSDLYDKEKIDTAFIRDIVGRYNVILPNADEVRSYLERTVATLPYDWYGDPTVQREVEKFAQARYNQGGSDQVLAKIEKMDANKTKEYLKRLIKNSIDVGISIMLEGE